MKTFKTVLCLLVIVYITGCKTKHAAHESATFTVTTAMVMDTTISKSYVCQINSRNHIEIRALESGYIDQIFVDEGNLVNAGQRMFQIKPALYKAEVNKAEAEADFAKIEYLNTKSLADKNVVSENELALAKAKYDKANAELMLAQVHLSFTTISAPFKGIMDRLEVRLGSLIEEGELLTELSDNSEMWVYFNVPEAEYLEYKPLIRKQQSIDVSLMMANNKQFNYPGKVETIEADFNNETGNIAFRATFPNPEGLLRHGETGRVIIKEEKKSAVIIPMKCTFDVLDKKYVYVIDANKKIHSREIVVEDEMDHLFIISKGLSKTDKILYEGLRQVHEGDEINVKFIEPSACMRDLNLYAE